MVEVAGARGGGQRLALARWRSGGQRYSTLKQITPANVAQLTHGVDVRHRQPGASGDAACRRRRHVSSAPGPTVFALEPETAKVIWKFGISSRRQPARCRVLGRKRCDAAADSLRRWRSRLVAIDAKTGAAIPSFGDNGSVDLKTGIKGDVDGRITLRLTAGDLQERHHHRRQQRRAGAEPGLYGDIRGWDAVTGKLLWSFHTVPRPGEPGNDTWEGDSWKSRSGTNMWSFFTVDVERGLVFVPTGSPTVRLLRRRSQGKQSLRQFGHRARCQHRNAEVGASARASRPVGLRPARRADA